MKSYNNLWGGLCSLENLFLAYKKARKKKTGKLYVQEFEKDLLNNLLKLQYELQNKTYSPKPLITFTIREPKTRKISKSDFRDRIIHHALCNILEPIFDKTFIHDSYANRKGKGTLKAVERFDHFKRKVSRNNTRKCFVFKADIKKYFDNVDHKTLLKILNKKVVDADVLWLVQRILGNHQADIKGRGMPLGNLTSQFFANIYLNQLDRFVKHRLKAKYYIRYVDDFVILDSNKEKLSKYKEEINNFLKQNLKIEFHPDKSKIFQLGNSLTFLGFRIFCNHKLLKRSSIRKMKNKYKTLKNFYNKKEFSYDKVYDFMEGWIAYAKNANTYKLRKNILTNFGKDFGGCISAKEIDRRLRYAIN